MVVDYTVVLRRVRAPSSKKRGAAREGEKNTPSYLVHFYPLKQFQHCFKIVLSRVIVLCMRPLGLVDCAGVREHLIPRAREPRPIVNSGRAGRRRGTAGGGGDRKRVTEGIFLAKIFFHGAYLAHETHRFDGFSAVLRRGEGIKIRDGSRSST